MLLHKNNSFFTKIDKLKLKYYPINLKAREEGKNNFL